MAGLETIVDSDGTTWLTLRDTRTEPEHPTRAQRHVEYLIRRIDEDMHTVSLLATKHLFAGEMIFSDTLALQLNKRIGKYLGRLIRMRSATAEHFAYAFGETYANLNAVFGEQMSTHNIPLESITSAEPVMKQ